MEQRIQNEISENNRKEISADILCNFLEVCFHQILFARRVYPQQIFVKRKKYNVPVHMSCHPGLNIYLANVLSSAKSLFYKGEISHLILSISNKGKSSEKFVFEINKLLPNKKKDPFFMDTELSLRSVLLKILTCENLLKHFPEEPTFEILIHTNAESGMELLYKEDILRWTKTNDSWNKSQLLPLQSITDSEFINLQLFVLSSC